MNLHNGYLTDEISAKFDLNMMGNIERVESSSDLNQLNEQFRIQKQAALDEVIIEYVVKLLNLINLKSCISFNLIV